MRPSRCVEAAAEPSECWNPVFDRDRRAAGGGTTATAKRSTTGARVTSSAIRSTAARAAMPALAAEPCHDGKCGCAPDEIVRNGRCVDPMTDDSNCGECGVRMRP